MKTWKNLIFVAIIAILGIVGLVGCEDKDDDPEPEPRNNYTGANGTTTGTLFGGAHTAKIEGINLTATEWNGASTKITNALNTAYTALNGDFLAESNYTTAFGRGVTIILEKNPTDYINYKSSGDKTLYINVDKLSVLSSFINNAVVALYQAVGGKN